MFPDPRILDKIVQIIKIKKYKRERGEREILFFWGRQESWGFTPPPPAGEQTSEVILK